MRCPSHLCLIVTATTAAAAAAASSAQDEYSFEQQSGTLLGVSSLPFKVPTSNRRNLRSSSINWSTVLDEVRDCFENGSGICYNEDRVTGYDKSTCTDKWYEPYPNEQVFQNAVEAEMASTPSVDSKRVYAVKLRRPDLPRYTGYTSAIGDLWTTILGNDVAFFSYMRCTKAEFVLFSGTVSQAQTTSSFHQVELVFPLLQELKTSSNLLVMDDQQNSQVTRQPEDGMVELRLFIAPSASARLRRIEDFAVRWNQHFDTHLPTATSNTQTSEVRNPLLATNINVETQSPAHAPRGRVLATAANRLSLHIHRSHASRGRKLMMSEPEAYYLEARPTYKLLNLDANMLLQSGYTADVDDSRKILLKQTPLWEVGLKGEGQVIGVADSGLDTNSCFFKDSNVRIGERVPLRQYTYETHRKVAQYVAFVDGQEGVAGGHGTHVCGSIAGEADKDMAADVAGISKDVLQYSGAAPSSKLAFFDIGEGGKEVVSPPNSLDTDMFPYAHKVGARIHTNSWGGSDNQYTGDAREVDAYSFENQDFLVVFAAGNAGAGPPGAPGNVATPATAKSALTVGASANTDRSFKSWGSTCPDGLEKPCEKNMATFSANGPTSDGRIKPEIVAPGMYVGSAKSDETCDVVFIQGTSMAAPLVAGTAALIRQYLMEGYYPTGKPIAENAFEPMAALVKAILINSGQYLKGTYGGLALESEPSMAQGFGRVQLDTVLRVKGASKVAARGVDPSDPQSERNTLLAGRIDAMPVILKSDEQDVYRVRLLPNSPHPLKITLVWQDAPGSELGSKNIVNDLDLSLVTEDGNGDTLYPTQPGDIVGIDTINTVEQIVVRATPETEGFQTGEAKLHTDGGWVRVVVKANRIVQSSQPYALVINGGFSLENAQLFRSDGEVLTLFTVVSTSDSIVTGVIVVVILVGAVVGAKVGISLADHSHNKDSESDARTSAGSSEDGRSVRSEPNIASKTVSRTSEKISSWTAAVRDSLGERIDTDAIASWGSNVRSSIGSKLNQAKAKSAPHAKAALNRVTSFSSSSSSRKNDTTTFEHGLPKGWQVAIDPRTRGIHYIHHPSGKTSKKRPTAATASELDCLPTSIGVSETRTAPGRSVSKAHNRTAADVKNTGAKLFRKASGSLPAIRVAGLGSSSSNSWTRLHSPTGVPGNMRALNRPIAIKKTKAQVSESSSSIEQQKPVKPKKPSNLSGTSLESAPGKPLRRTTVTTIKKQRSKPRNSSNCDLKTVVTKKTTASDDDTAITRKKKVIKKKSAKGKVKLGTTKSTASKGPEFKGYEKPLERKPTVDDL